MHHRSTRRSLLTLQTIKVLLPLLPPIEGLQHTEIALFVVIFVDGIAPTGIAIGPTHFVRLTLGNVLRLRDDLLLEGFQVLDLGRQLTKVPEALVVRGWMLHCCGHGIAREAVQFAGGRHSTDKALVDEVSQLLDRGGDGRSRWSPAAARGARRDEWREASSFAGRVVGCCWRRRLLIGHILQDGSMGRWRIGNGEEIERLVDVDALEKVRFRVRARIGSFLSARFLRLQARSGGHLRH